MKISIAALFLFTLLGSSHAGSLRGGSASDDSTSLSDSSDAFVEAQSSAIRTMNLNDWLINRFLGAYGDRILPEAYNVKLRQEGLDIRFKNNDFKLEGHNPIKKEPVKSHSITLLNNGRIQRGYDVAPEVTTQRKFTAQTQQAFKWKAEVSGKIGFKKIAEVGASTSFEFGLTNTQTHEASTTETIKRNLKLDVPPHTRAELMLVVSTVYTSPKFEADVEIRAVEGIRYTPNGVPHVCVNYNPPHGAKGKGVCASFERVFGGYDDFVRSENDPNVYNYKLKGQFTGYGGMDDYIRVDEYCLKPFVCHNGFCEDPRELPGWEGAMDDESFYADMEIESDGGEMCTKKNLMVGDAGEVVSSVTVPIDEEEDEVDEDEEVESEDEYDYVR